MCAPRPSPPCQSVIYDYRMSSTLVPDMKHLYVDSRHIRENSKGVNAGEDLKVLVHLTNSIIALWQLGLRAVCATQLIMALV